MIIYNFLHNQIILFLILKYVYMIFNKIFSFFVNSFNSLTNVH